MKTVEFYSNRLKRTLVGEVIAETGTTVKLRLADGNVITKKKRQLVQEEDNV